LEASEVIERFNEGRKNTYKIKKATVSITL